MDKRVTGDVRCRCGHWTRAQALNYAELDYIRDVSRSYDCMTCWVKSVKVADALKAQPTVSPLNG